MLTPTERGLTLHKHTYKLKTCKQIWKRFMHIYACTFQNPMSMYGDTLKLLNTKAKILLLQK